MAPPGQVTLEVVAKVEEALKRLSSLEAKIKQLSSTGVASRVTLDVSQAEASLRSVTDKLAAFLNEAKTKGSIVLKADAQAALTAVTNAERTITASLDRIKAKAAGSDPLTPLAVQAQKAAASINADLDKLDKSVDKTFQALKKRAAENVFAGLGEQAAKEANKLNAEFKKLETAFASALKRLNAESRKADFSPASESARKLRENVRLAAEDIAAFAGRVKTSTAAAGGDFKRLEEAERAAAAAVREFPKEGPIGPGFLSNITSATNLMRTFLASLVAQRLLEFGRAATDAAVKLELLQAALTGLLGSSTVANEKLASLRQTADDFGVSFISLVESYRSFAPAAEAAGLTLEETDAVFKSVAISARALGLSTEESQRVLLAFRQVLQKGKFTAEELTQQIGEVLPSALAILGKELGKSSDELYAMMKAGQLTSDALLLLAAGQVEAFGPAAIGNARTAAAEIERYKNGIFDLKAAVGAGLVPALVELLDALKDSGAEGKEAFASIGEAAGDLLTNVTRAVKAVRDVLSLNFNSLFKELQASLVGFIDFVVSPFQNLRDVLAVGLHQIGALSDEALESVKKGSLEFSALLDDLRSGYRGLADDARGTGDAFADSMTEANTRVAREAKELEDKLRTGYDRLSDAHGANAEKMTKKDLSELSKRQKGFETFFTAISKLAQASRESGLPSLDAPAIPEATGGGKSPKLTELQTQIKEVEKAAAALRAELARVEGQDIIAGDEIGKAQDLRGEIGRLESDLQKLKLVEAGESLSAGFEAEQAAIEKAGAATEANATKIQQALFDLVNRNDDFRESFAELPAAAQSAVTAIVGQLERVAASGRVTNADITEFGSRLLDVFTKSGAVSAEFAAKLKGELGSVEGSFGSAELALSAYSAALKATAADGPEAAAAINATTAAAAKQDPVLQALLSYFRQVPDATLSAKTAQEVFGLSLDQVAVKLREAGVGVLQANGELTVVAGTLASTTTAVISFDEATKRYTTSADSTTRSIQAQDTALQALLGYFQQHPGSAISAKTAQDQFGLSLDEVSGKLRAAGLDVVTLDGQLQVVTKSADGAGGGFLRVGDKVLEIKSKATEAGKGLDEAGKKIGELGAKELDAKPATSVEKLATAGKSAADNMKATGDAALAAEPPLTLAAAAAEKFAAAHIDATGADAIVAIGAAAAVATPGLTGAATAVEKIAAGLKGITAEQAEALTALGVAASTTGPQLETAAEPAGKFGEALKVIAGSLGTIKVDVGEVSTGLGDLATAITSTVEQGTLSTLAGAFGDLETVAKPLATDLVGMATALEDLVKNAAPAAEGLEDLQGAAEKVDLRAATTGVNDLNTATEKLAASLKDSSDNAGTLDTGLKASAGSAGELKVAASALADELADHFKRALGVAVAELGNLATGLADAKKATGDLRADLAKLGTEGVQQINNTTTAVNGLAAALQSALELARQLRSEMSQISLG